LRFYFATLCQSRLPFKMEGNSKWHSDVCAWISNSSIEFHFLLDIYISKWALGRRLCVLLILGGLEDDEYAEYKADTKKEEPEEVFTIEKALLWKSILPFRILFSDKTTFWNIMNGERREKVILPSFGHYCSLWDKSLGE
jgi:hypothetical protein